MQTCCCDGWGAEVAASSPILYAGSWSLVVGGQHLWTCLPHGVGEARTTPGTEFGFMHLGTKLPAGHPASHYAKVLPWLLQLLKCSTTCLHEFFPAARAAPVYEPGCDRSTTTLFQRSLLLTLIAHLLALCTISVLFDQLH